MTEYVTSNIHSVLKKYQNSAPKSLQGPGHALATATAVATNCMIDGVPDMTSIGGVGTSGATSPIENGILVNGAKCPSSQHATAVPLIKKETSSPEPNELHVMVPLVTAALPPPPHIYPPPPPELSQPILSVADSGSGELYETRLEGKTIGCFSLGGEMRLCLPQFLNNVLADFSLEQINRIFDDLGIYCSQCTPDQLLEFKAARILPMDVKASGLITRTDAERLCAAMLNGSDRSSYLTVDNLPKSAITFRVYHKCFGKCEGICTPDMYSYHKPTCIKCLECDGWFSPQKFVGHVHRQFENRTCHWGFDSRNWHDYLHVALDVENREKYQRILDKIDEVETNEKLKTQYELDSKKRKMDMLTDDPMGPLGISIGQNGQLLLHQSLPPKYKHRGEMFDIPAKKYKTGLGDPTAYHLDIQRYHSLVYAHCVQQQQRGSMSAFRPWGPSKPFMHPYSVNTVAAISTLPYLSQEPPVLQNPERVVLNTDRERFERTYQPNVALAPRKNVMIKEREKEHGGVICDRGFERELKEREHECEIGRTKQLECSIEHEKEMEHESNGKEPYAKKKKHQDDSHMKVCESDLFIKQERANTPTETSQTSPPPPHSSDIDGMTLDHHRYNDLNEEDSSMPFTSPSISHGINQRRHRSSQENVEILRVRKHSHHISSSFSNSSLLPLPGDTMKTPHQTHFSSPINSQFLQQRHVQQQQQQQQQLQQQQPIILTRSGTSRSPMETSGNTSEITSSTSPIPGNNNNIAHNNNLLQQNEINTVNQHAKLLPAVSIVNNNTITNSSNNNNNNNKQNNSNHEIPSRIRISKGLINSANIIRSPTPPLSMMTTNQKYSYNLLKQQQNEQQREHFIKQHHLHIGNSNYLQRSPPAQTGLNLTTNTASSCLTANRKQYPQQQHHHNQIEFKSHMGSELELSTDTDDDSLNGEPDSNNILPPWEVAVEALRDTRPRDRERILHILQRLLQENQQYRYNNMQLSDMLYKRDAHVLELREELQYCRRELENALKNQQQNESHKESTASQIAVANDLIQVKTSRLHDNNKKNNTERNEITDDSDDTENHSMVAVMNQQEVEKSLPQQGSSSTLQRRPKPILCGEQESKRFKIDHDALSENSLDNAKVNDLNTDEDNNNDDGVDDDDDDESYHLYETDNSNKARTAQQQQQAKQATSDKQDDDDDDNDNDNDDGDDDNDEQTKRENEEKASANQTNIGESQCQYAAAAVQDESDESITEQSSDVEDSINEVMNEVHQHHVEAPHSNALASPPTATTPISPDSAATAGQLFDSSNSSDESSMKKAQMSASNALAKMSSEDIAELEANSDSESGDEENAKDKSSDGRRNDDNLISDKLSLQQQQRKLTTFINPNNSIDSIRSHNYHLKERTNYGNNCDQLNLMAATQGTGIAATIPRTLTLPTKASRKQTPTTNCDLQIKREMV